MSTLALSRTCDLRDFPACLTVASWQQCLAALAWDRWTEAQHRRTREGSIVVNYSGVAFEAPGPTATYWYRAEERQPINGPAPAPALYALCVLDRIEAPVAFLTQTAHLLQPQGLLFLTFAFWDAEGPDTAMGHEERTRIYSAHSYQRLIRDARHAGFEPFGGTDWRYHGDCLDDHSLASLVFTKR
jgi:hypothetical protein